MGYYNDQKYPSEFNEGDVINTSVGYAQVIMKLVEIKKESHNTFATYRYLTKNNISNEDRIVAYKENMPYTIVTDEEVASRIKTQISIN